MKHTYTKKEALKIVIATAKEYQRNLEGLNYLFVYRDRKSNNVEFFETNFLPRNFLQFSKMTTLYNGVRHKLSMERIAGTTNYCMGFIKDNDYYVPNSCLLEDIRNLGETPSQILAIFSKRANEKDGTYKNVCYVAKGVPLDKIQMPKVLQEKIIQSEK